MKKTITITISKNVGRAPVDKVLAEYDMEIDTNDNLERVAKEIVEDAQREHGFPRVDMKIDTEGVSVTVGDVEWCIDFHSFGLYLGIERLWREAEECDKWFVFGDAVYTADEALDVMMDHADDDMNMNGYTTIEEFLDDKRRCMTEAKHEYHIDYFFRNGTEFVDDGTWDTVSTFTELPSCMEGDNPESILDDFVYDQECEGGHKGGLWRIVDHDSANGCKTIYTREWEQYAVLEDDEEIETFDTYEEALDFIRTLEKKDLESKCYKRGSYEIWDIGANRKERIENEW